MKNLIEQIERMKENEVSKDVIIVLNEVLELIPDAKFHYLVTNTNTCKVCPHLVEVCLENDEAYCPYVAKLQFGEIYFSHDEAEKAANERNKKQCTKLKL